MASRRVRIKGIANIPQRRKNDESLPNDDDGKKQLETKTNIISEVDETNEKSISENNNNDMPSKIAIEETDNTQVISKPFAKPSDITASMKPKRQNEYSNLKLANCTTSNNGQINEHLHLVEKSTIAPLDNDPSSMKLINRLRIKAVPNLDGRRISIHGSASESEEETRRNNINCRVRTDSICTVASATADVDTYFSSPRVRQYSSLIQRKCRRSEQSRKMAEARREFAQKFGHGSPEKSRLTMMDLIFYNPSSNPMSKRKTTEASPANSEKIIEIDEQHENDEMEEDNASLVPQIKVGPDGNIILDEQSLVIDQTSSRNQDILDTTPVVDGNFETGYGVYKKAKRSKDWTHAETVRFYRALNTIGTDFSIMGNFFPRRTRRELKMKFKKEERLNQDLVDKALKLPLNFDITTLKKDMEEEERLYNEEQERKTMKRKLQEERRSNPNAKRIRRKKLSELSKELLPTKSCLDVQVDEVKAAGMDLESDDEEIKVVMLRNKNSDCDQPQSIPSDKNFTSKREKIVVDKENKKMKPRQHKPTKKKHEEKASWELSGTSSDDDEEVPILRPTRSGRVPKPRILDIPSYESLSPSNIVSTKPPPRPPQVPNLLPHGVNQVPTGSIIVVSSVDCNGLPMYKVFVVTSEQQRVPVTLSTDKMESLTKNLGQAIHITLPTHQEEEPLPPENNYTIAEPDPKELLQNQQNECNDASALGTGAPEPSAYVTVSAAASESSGQPAA